MKLFHIWVCLFTHSAVLFTSIWTVLVSWCRRRVWGALWCLGILHFVAKPVSWLNQKKLVHKFSALLIWFKVWQRIFKEHTNYANVFYFSLLWTHYQTNIRCFLLDLKPIFKELDYLILWIPYSKYWCRFHSLVCTGTIEYKYIIGLFGHIKIFFKHNVCLVLGLNLAPVQCNQVIFLKIIVNR